MIQIFSYGRNLEMPRFLFTCHTCGCEFAAQLEDRQIDRDGRYVVCPCCKKFVDWETGEIIHE
jgi:DNA-directed RNA polymerase subunit RPC12/RpoP